MGILKSKVDVIIPVCHWGKRLFKLLEGLAGQIPGLLDIKVQTECLESSNTDVMLDSTFVDAQALKTYASHPAHVKVADNNVRPFTKTRACMDFEV